MNLADVLDRLEAVRPIGTDRYSARCPAHHDRTPSLSVGAARTGSILLTCHAGCDVESVCTALGITQADLFPDAE